MTENKKILVIGLGSMGYGIAKSLIRSGYKVYGQDKNIDQQQKFIQDGGLEGEVLYDQLEAVIIVVLNEQQTSEIIFGEDGIANKLQNDTLIMVCTTVSPDFAREMDNKCVEKGLLYSYRDRKNKKRSFRLLWIIRINAAARLNGITYGKLISNLKSKKVSLDRKVLSDIAMNHPDTFSKIVNKVK